MRWFIALQVLVVTGVAIGAGLIHAAVSPDRGKVEAMVPTWYHQGELAARRNLEVERERGEVAHPIKVEENSKDGDAGASVVEPESGNAANSVSAQGDEFDINTIGVDISLDEAKALWDRQLATFVDARKYDIYKLGHIEDAISIPYDVIRSMNGVPPHVQHGIIEPGQTPLVIYCKGGDCDESLLVAAELRGMGFKCYIFLDGFPAWRESIFPIANGPDPYLVDFHEEPGNEPGAGG